MNTMEHFLELRLCFREVETYRSFEVSLEELSEVLICSTRNVKRLLKNMERGGAHLLETGRRKGKAIETVFQMLPEKSPACPCARSARAGKAQ